MSEGYATVLHGKAYIFLKRGRSKETCRFTLAHELGHLLLGHIGDWNSIRGRDLPKDQQENEADRFAKQLLQSGWAD